MSDGKDPVDALREAVRLSPDNLPLRQHLAGTLLGFGRLAEAEQAYREALALAPHHQGLKIGLATTYYRRGKNSHALVIIEELLKLADTPPEAYLLHARLLVRAGNIELAVRQYQKATGADPDLADHTLAEQLGIGGRGRSWTGGFASRRATTSRTAMSRWNARGSSSWMSAGWSRSRTKSG